MISSELKKSLNEYENYISRHGIDIDVTNAYFTAVFWANEKDNDIETALKIAPRAKELINQYVINGAGGDIWELEKFCFANKTGHEMVDKWYEILKLEAPYLLESFAFYMEKNRPPEERFYQPRVNPQRRVIQGIQDLADDKLDEIFVNEPSRVGKTQTVKIGFLWYGSRNPELSNLYTAYSDKITSGFYDGLIELMTDPTYTYAEIFPKNVEKKLITDGKDLTIDLIRKKTYPTFTSRSIYGTLNGACDCNGLAVADDLFSGIEITIGITDEINKMASDRSNGIEQFVSSWVKFVNCEMDETTWKNARASGALVVKSNNGSDNKADVDIMTSELNQTESQVVVADQYEKLLVIQGMASRQGNTGGDTQGAVELRNGHYDAEKRSELSEPILKRAERQALRIILNRLRINKNFTLLPSDVEIHISRTKMDNMQVKAQTLQMLLTAGIKPERSIKTVGLFSDPEQVAIESRNRMNILYPEETKEKQKETKEME